MSDSEASREDRQLEASQRRIEQARAEGQLARSRELVHLAAAAALLALLTWGGAWIGEGALVLVSQGLRFDRNAAFETALVLPRLATLAGEGLLLAAPAAAALALLLTAATLAVGGWNVAPKALIPKPERLDPIAGFGRLFSLRGLLDHGRIVLTAATFLSTAAWYLQAHADVLAQAARLPLLPGLAHGVLWMADGIQALVLAALAASLVDVPMQVLRQRRDLRMSHQEAREEHKESEGDPHLKGERRRRARELSRGRMLTAVPQASVVVTNPTHYAVALRYDGEGGGAPRVVAAGADLLALRIRELAAAAGVPLLEAPPLARALYRHAQVGQEIPVALYTAVAQVLAWVFSLRGAAVLPQPAIEVPRGMDPQEASDPVGSHP